MRLVGVDIGGTSIKVGLFDSTGKMNDFFEYDTESHKGGPYIMGKLVEKIRQFKHIDAIGVSTAGQVDRKQGILVQEAVNIPQTAGLQIKNILTEKFQVPVAVENDVNAAALGESHYGIGQELKDFLFLTYGTGIGGAIVIDSDIYYGKSGYAAEFGHMIIHGNGKQCNCGLQGCYETYASTSALINNARQIHPNYTNGRVIFERFHQGDKAVQDLISDWIKEIIYGLTSLIHIFNPSSIVIGGGIMEQDVVVEMISKEVNRQILQSFRQVNILKASLGNRAGMLGAISLHVKNNE